LIYPLFQEQSIFQFISGTKSEGIGNGDERGLTRIRTLAITRVDDTSNALNVVSILFVHNYWFCEGVIYMIIFVLTARR
jgi:hypothetical protein